jgi:AraC-like DNA-binding protein
MTGQSPHNWLRGLRMDRAVELLAGGSSVKETAVKLGCQSRANFSHDFKRYYGYSPRAVGVSPGIE